MIPGYKILRAVMRHIMRDETGAMAIETAVIAPVLVVMAIGGFEVSTMVSRQTELQSAVAEAASIVRATLPESAEERTTVKNILKTSTGLSDYQVSVSEIYRCGTQTDYITTEGGCTNGAHTTTYIRVTLLDSYVPVWTDFGLGSTVQYRVSRTILVG